MKDTAKATGAEALEGLLRKVMKDLKKRGLTREDLAEAWESAAGKRATKHTRASSIRKGTLIVKVDSSPWLYELTLKKRLLLEKLAAKLKDKAPKKLRLRIGDIKNG